MHATPIGAPVVVYTSQNDVWEGPYFLLETRGEEVVFLTPKGASKFRSIKVKP